MRFTDVFRLEDGLCRSAEVPELEVVLLPSRGEHVRAGRTLSHPTQPLAGGERVYGDSLRLLVLPERDDAGLHSRDYRTDHEMDKPCYSSAFVTVSANSQHLSVP